MSEIDKKIEDIKKLFNSIGCPAVVILKTSFAGFDVDNGCGMDFDLPPYAVIHDNNFYGSNKNGIVYDWQYENKTELLKFDSVHCKPNIDALIQELRDRDGYEIMWRRDENIKDPA